MKRFAIKIVGPAGFGIKITGVTLAKTFLRQGFNVFGYTEYPSLIRGGHNTYQVDIADKEIKSASAKCDILIGLTRSAINKELKNINPDGIIICDEDLETINTKIKVLRVPLVKIAKKHGDELMKNTVALGVLMKALGLKMNKLEKVLEDIFKDKNGVAESNINAAQDGYETVFKAIKPLETPKKAEATLYMTGNQATAMGVIASGCQLYVAYPMTPATDILHILEAKQREIGMVVHQPEDEIAAIHAVLGSSFAGVRSACGTSGGGFALMNEGLSLAGQVELPAVIFEVQRPGPATGNPTWTEQGDLGFVLHAGHGEFPRIVIAPGDPDQCFDLVQHAFNLADKYQVPVIVISDKFLGESGYSVPKDVFDEIDKIDRGKVYFTNQKFNKHAFKRYEVTADGVSWRTIPTVDGGEHACLSACHDEDGARCGEYIANSDEHNRLSLSDESSDVRTRMVNKRMAKLASIRQEIPLPRVYGPKSVKTTLVTWGSMFGPCLDAISELKDTNLILFNYLWPLPKNLDKFLKKFKNLVLVENNKTGQLGKLIRSETGIEIKNKLLKYDSRPFWWDEIVSKLTK